MAKLRVQKSLNIDELLARDTPTLHELRELVNDLIERLDRAHRAAYDDNIEGRTKRVTTATDYTASARDTYIGVTSTAAARTVTLPTVAAAGKNRVIEIKDESGGAGTNNITVDGAGSETIDGAANYVIGTNYGSVTVICTGAAWEVLSTAKEGTKASEIDADGDLAMGGHKITGLADGTASGDALHAGQVDDVTLEVAGEPPAGVLQIKAGGISNSHIAADAAIALSKIAVSGLAEIKVGTYTGNAAEQAVAVGFQPNFIIVSRHGAPGGHYLKTTDMAGFYAKDITDAGWENNRIQIDANGFTVKNLGNLSINLATYSYLAIRMF